MKFNKIFLFTLAVCAALSVTHHAQARDTDFDKLLKEIKSSDSVMVKIVIAQQKDDKARTKLVTQKTGHVFGETPLKLTAKTYLSVGKDLTSTTAENKAKAQAQLATGEIIDSLIANGANYIDLKDLAKEDKFLKAKFEQAKREDVQKKEMTKNR